MFCEWRNFQSEVIEASAGNQPSSPAYDDDSGCTCFGEGDPLEKCLAKDSGNTLSLPRAFSHSPGATTTAEYKEFVAVAVAWESFAIAADMTVMCSLIGTLLYRRTGFRQTDWLLYNLILVAIECAVPVTLFTIGHMTGVVASPTTAMHQLFAWSQARLYSNTLFVNLNARNKLRRGPDSVGQVSGNNIREVNFLSNRSMGPQVRVDVTREEHFAMDSISNKETHTDDFKSLDQV
ncbi:hypothetical protein BT96DRAFT_1023536 [Gymnopus androsaceus JB14]|uniref:DUF6534 domain-containing protein n=1 Tax=Gymnopus androsaceus JB14 TaxID=1447944 RepID=A0A6A4H5I7_9AGAR|nr:hypothetical protein BT96DRAFT_1023536 [Gymnopus androsaceus JB14]